jgi:hypothetical protein
VADVAATAAAIAELAKCCGRPPSVVSISEGAPALYLITPLLLIIGGIEALVIRRDAQKPG